MANIYSVEGRTMGMSEYPVEATATTARVIDALSKRGTTGVTELATQLGLSKSAVHNHLATLEQLGFAINDGGRYRLSLRFLDYGIRIRDSLPVVTAGREEADSLASQSGSAAFIVISEFNDAVYAYVTTGRHTEAPPSEVRPGCRVPLHACAPGKAMLSTRSTEAIEAYLDTDALSSRTERTITEPDELRRELRSVRDRGIAFDRGEATVDVNAVAAPITDGDGAVGAMGVAGPAAALSGKRLQEDLPGLVLNHVTTVELALVG
jgi:DNA-binding IclR family transcriptional regulator